MDNIIVKKGDKSGAIVIIDKEYEVKLHKHTKKFPKNIDKEIMKKIHTFTKKQEENLTGKGNRFLVDFESRSSDLYGLPKIHTKS